MHLFAGHEQLVPITGSSYTFICWVFVLHAGSTGVLHNKLQFADAFPLKTPHTHFSLQSTVIKVWLMSYVLLPYSHFAERIVQKKIPIKVLQ